MRWPTNTEASLRKNVHTLTCWNECHCEREDLAYIDSGWGKPIEYLTIEGLEMDEIRIYAVNRRYKRTDRNWASQIPAKILLRVAAEMSLGSMDEFESLSSFFMAS